MLALAVVVFRREAAKERALEAELAAQRKTDA
jgi:hypothetical protein